MFHGAPGGVSKASYAKQANAVAEQGFVVFVPDWGGLVNGGGGVPTPGQFELFISEGACAVAFARSHAAEYGGNADTLILFGHSAGANLVGGIAFSSPDPTSGCPGGDSLGPIDAIVTWDGDWNLIDYSWDGPLAGDPSRWEATTQFWDITSDPNLKVVMIASDIVGPYVRNLADAGVSDTFFSVRGPNDFLLGQVEAIGALTDNAYDIKEMQQLFFTQLEAQGNPVTLTMLPGASHDSFGQMMKDAAMAVFVAAFKEAAGT
jgi:acetyl esterase/lipase